MLNLLTGHGVSAPGRLGGRANFCSSLPPVRFLFNLLIVYQIFDRLSRI